MSSRGGFHRSSSQASSGNRSSGGGGGGGNRSNGGGGSGSGGGGGGRRRNSRVDTSRFPLEQGIICSLKESFGFIHCAERPEEIFFHYSEVANCYPDELTVDTEVEFRVGSSEKDASKLAAYKVTKVPTGTVVWETEDEPDKFFQGLVERNIRPDQRGMEGSIQVRVAEVEEQKQAEKDSDNGNGSGNGNGNGNGNGDKANSNVNANANANAKGPMVRFRGDDYTPESTSNVNANADADANTNFSNAGGGGGSSGSSSSNRRNSSSSSSIMNNANSNRLFRGDLVQFRILIDRRTKQRYARYITLLQTEKERTRMEREQRLMATAVPEQGIVMSLHKGYGFLRSNQRREHVYFHYSHLILPEDDDDFELKRGQELKFLVVTEGNNNNGPEDNNYNSNYNNNRGGGDYNRGGLGGAGAGAGGPGGGKPKCSARQLECLPKGSVEFHKVVRKGVQGIVTLCPQPPTGMDRGYADDKDGTIRLLEPLIEEQQKDGEAKEISVQNILLEFADAPGGVYSFTKNGNSMLGVWITEGDTLLFDIVKELADGSYRAAPTLHTLGVGGTVEEPASDAEESTAVVHLAATSLVSRAEGVLHNVKLSGGYGFIHFAERPIDVHFQTYNLLPEEIQADLRKQLGVDPAPVKLEMGAGIQFDICAHGTVSSASRKQRGNNRGKSPPRTHDRENIKAHRILALPPSYVSIDKSTATGVKGTVKSIDYKQLYAGFIDLDDEVEAMSLADRHPLVAQMVDSFLEESGRPSGRKSLVFKDVLSVKDDEVVVEMVKARGNDLLSCNHIAVAGMHSHPGRLILRRIEEGDDAPKEEDLKSTPMRKRQAKPNKDNIRFDKSSLCDDLKEDIPAGIGDIVTCDIVQSRRSGKFLVHNLKIVERKVLEEGEFVAGATGVCGVGVVKDVVVKRDFGFISLLDENSTKREVIFFNLSDGKPGKRGGPRKGDEVQFDIVVDKSGKRVAKNIEVVPRGTIPSKAAKNACLGLLLMEPTHTSLGNTPLRKQQSSMSASSDKSSRWGNVKEDSKKAQHTEIHGKGYILLTEDKHGLFSMESRIRRKSGKSFDGEDDAKSVDTMDDAKSIDDDVRSVDTQSDDDMEAMGSGGILSQILYKNGAIAIHGSGSSSAIDSSSNPRRGDLVSFVKSRKGTSACDVRVETRQAATLLRGRLENIEYMNNEASRKNVGTAMFIASTDKEERYEIDLAEVVSCDAALLKEKQQVEGILHAGKIYGVCRTTDLYLESKLGKSHKERPKLNLNVKKNKGGRIMAQSMMAKGPDGTDGFAPGWTTRTSQYANPETNLQTEIAPKVSKL